MARYNHLPLYKKAMELAVFIENAVRGFSRYNKYTIGTRLVFTTKDTKSTKGLGYRDGF